MNRPNRRRSRMTRRPRVESLEPRQLLSYAGSPDSSFGGGTGAVVVPVTISFQSTGPSKATETATALQPDGKILVAGTFVQNGAQYLDLARLNPDGTFDASFGQGGQTILPAAQAPSQILVQGDGKIVVVGSGMYPELYAIRYTANGLFDATYGTNGIVQIPIPNGAKPAQVVHLAGGALDANGDLVIAGDVQVKPQGNLGLGGEVDDLVVARLTQSGSLDTSFATTGIDEIPVAIGQYTEDTAGGIAIQPDGKIVVAGSAVSSYTVDPMPPVTDAAQTQPIVVRLNSDGTLDTSFGATSTTPGEVTFPVQPGNSSSLGDVTVSGLAIQSGGRIVLAANGTGIGSNGNVLYGLTSAGAVDPAFGVGGMADSDNLGSIAAIGLEPDGEIVAVSNDPTIIPGSPVYNPSYTVSRFNLDGSIDSGFGPYGLGTIPPDYGPTTGSAIPGSLAIGPDGSIYAAASVNAVLGGADVPTFAVAKLIPAATPAPGSPGGTPDPVFGDQTGSAIAPVATNFQSTGPTSVKANATAVQADGKVLIAGTIVEDGKTYITLARLDPDGSRDTSFGQGGEALFADSAAVASVLVQADGKILVVGNTLNTSNGGSAEFPEVLAVRFNADGSLDTTYSNHGVAQFGILMNDGTTSSQVTVAGAVLDSAGNLVIAGNALVLASSVPNNTESLLVVARITPAGALDTTFDGSGVEKVPISFSSGGNPPIIQNTAGAIAIQSDGKIVIAGSAIDEYAVITTANGGFTEVPQTQPIVVRLDADGSPDAGFGTAGTAILPNEPANFYFPLESVTIDALTFGTGGQIILGGVKDRSAGPLSVLDRLDASGNLDPTFGLGGEITASDGDGITSLVLGANDEVIAGTVQNTVYRFDETGDPDGTFGNTSTPGLASISYGTGSSMPRVNALATLANGDILVAGTTETDLGGDLVTVFAATELDPNPVPAPNITVGFSAGSLDFTFGLNSGTATVGFPQDSAASATAEAVQPDGDILLAGKELARLLPDGSLDTSFGTGGTIPLANGTVQASAVFVLPTGKIEVFGYAGTTPVTLRYTASGQPDAAYGTGGEVSYPIASDPLFPASAKAAIQPDGRLVVAGNVGNSNGEGDSIVIIRLNGDGSIDTSFGTGGAEIQAVPSVGSTGLQSVAGVVVQPNGAIVVAGNVDASIALIPEPLSNVFAFRLTPSGTLDAAFGPSNPYGSPTGIVILDPQTENPTARSPYSITGVVLEPDGHIVLGGSTFGSVIVTVLNPDGNLDAAFGHLGVATVPTDQAYNGQQEAGGGVIVEPNGQIVVAATINEVTADEPEGTTALLAARFNTDGTLDTSFGNPDTPGVATYLPGDSIAQANAVVVQADGDVLIAGSAELAASGDVPASQAFAVARIRYQPTRDI